MPTHTLKKIRQRVGKRAGLNLDTKACHRMRLRPRLENYLAANPWHNFNNAAAVLLDAGLKHWEHVASLPPVAPIMDEEDATAAAMRKAGR
jgi:hypothetical protein